ncbi:hypothetical protein CEXT_528711 [Caerostris extrusa]|uniref:Uncharacterized protein n=1 Tax=Caerostris extrusa TaxID=172846 RepID=A0AAV4N8E2_CAEEX|nr:hypothetical protein CEXT_528711 [Caerostris extrusa]
MAPQEIGNPSMSPKTITKQQQPINQPKFRSKGLPSVLCQGRQPIPHRKHTAVRPGVTRLHPWTWVAYKTLTFAAHRRVGNPTGDRHAQFDAGSVWCCLLGVCAASGGGSAK